MINPTKELSKQALDQATERGYQQGFNKGFIEGASYISLKALDQVDEVWPEIEDLILKVFKDLEKMKLDTRTISPQMITTLITSHLRLWTHTKEKELAMEVIASYENIEAN